MRKLFSVLISFRDVVDKNAPFKAAAKDMRYFARSKVFGSSVHKEKFGLIWQV